MSRQTSRACWVAVPIVVLYAASAAAQPIPGGAPPQPTVAGQPVGSPPPIIVQQLPAPPAPNLPPAPVLPTVELGQLLDRVARKSNKQFLMSFRASQQVFLGGARIDDVDYPMLLQILRNNGMAAFVADGRVNIVPDADVRAAPLPIVNTDDPAIGDEEYVTRIITVSDSPMLVPVIRPLLPQSAHLAAIPPDKLLVVDRYANVRRITQIVKEIRP